MCIFLNRLVIATKGGSNKARPLFLVFFFDNLFVAEEKEGKGINKNVSTMDTSVRFTCEKLKRDIVRRRLHSLVCSRSLTRNGDSWSVNRTCCRGIVSEIVRFVFAIMDDAFCVRF